MTVSIIKITKKTLALLTLYFLLNAFLTLNLYAKDSLPTIKNSTPWKVKFKYEWFGCGSFNAYKDKSSSDHLFGPHKHTSRKKIASGDTYTLKTGCFARIGASVYITPYNLSDTFLDNLTLSIKEGNTISCIKTFCVCKGQFCQEENGSWEVPRDKVLPTLKYDSSKKNEYNAYSGYYWYMDTNQ